MEIKLGNSNLRHWQNAYNWTTRLYEHNVLEPGMRVCSASNRKWLGVITGIGEPEVRKMYHAENSTTEINQVEVYWLSGPNKGTKGWKKTDSLVNYDDYKASIAAALKELEDNEKEAAKTGM